MNLALKQAAGTQLRAWWELSQRGNVSFSTQLTESVDNLLISSKAALITEPSATALVNTVLMNWWSAINYIRGEIAYKREVQTDMKPIYTDKPSINPQRSYGNSAINVSEAAPAANAPNIRSADLLKDCPLVDKLTKITANPAHSGLPQS